MKTEPLVRAARTARREFATGQLAAIGSEFSKWRRRETIAASKLRELTERLMGFAEQLAWESDGRDVRGDVLARLRERRRK